MFPLYTVVDGKTSRTVSLREAAEYVSRMIVSMKDEEMRSDFTPKAVHFKMGQGLIYHFGGLVSRLSAEADCEVACRKHERDMDALRCVCVYVCVCVCFLFLFFFCF